MSEKTSPDQCWDKKEKHGYDEDENIQNCPQWEMDKEQLKVLTDQLQKMSRKIGVPILLSVHPSGNKCVALYNQMQPGAEFEGEIFFVKVKSSA
ncbi:MAG: hypothetical protein N2645_09455 [Clostridia bacterium]|nr:hypothetical protein [Clostridia bacterium]